VNLKGDKKCVLKSSSSPPNESDHRMNEKHHHHHAYMMSEWHASIGQKKEHNNPTANRAPFILI